MSLRFVTQASDGRSYLLTTKKAAAAFPEKRRQLTEAGVTVAGFESADGRFRLPPQALSDAAAAWGFDSVMVEGGCGLISSLAAADAFDAGEIFVAPVVLGDREAVPLADGFSPDAIDGGWRLPNAETALYDGQVSYRFQKKVW